MPATISTVAPGLINSPLSLVPLTFSPVSAEVFKLKPDLLIISATLPAVTNLLALSPSGFVTVPPVDVKVAVSGCFTSTVIVRIPSTVLPDTVAAPVPTNFTSFAFFTVSL